MRPALIDRGPTESTAVLYLTAFLSAAALAYLGYAMIRPERF